MRWLVVLSLSLGVVAACDEAPIDDVPLEGCTPGDVVSCECPGGYAGVENCDAQRVFGMCQCPSLDSSLPLDEGADPVDSASVDAWVDVAEPDVAVDAEVVNEGVDAVVDVAVVDATPCVPQCGTRTCGPDPVCGESCGTCLGRTQCAVDARCEPMPPEPPVIVSFAPNSETLFSGMRVQFIAEVHDADGLDTLVAAQLETRWGLVLAPFVPSEHEGVFLADISWDELHAVWPVSFQIVDRRVFVARFIDDGDFEVRAEATLSLRCPLGESACDGFCTPDFECRCQFPGAAYTRCEGNLWSSCTLDQDVIYVDCNRRGGHCGLFGEPQEICIVGTGDLCRHDLGADEDLFFPCGLNGEVLEDHGCVYGGEGYSSCEVGLPTCEVEAFEAHCISATLLAERCVERADTAQGIYRDCRAMGLTVICDGDQGRCAQTLGGGPCNDALPCAFGMQCQLSGGRQVCNF